MYQNYLAFLLKKTQCVPPARFLQFVVSASEHLFQCGRFNVVYTLAKAIGRKRPDGSDSRFPAKRMPKGLLEHMVNFYNADSVP